MRVEQHSRFAAGVFHCSELCLGARKMACRLVYLETGFAAILLRSLEVYNYVPMHIDSTKAFFLAVRERVLVLIPLPSIPPFGKGDDTGDIRLVIREQSFYAFVDLNIRRWRGLSRRNTYYFARLSSVAVIDASLATLDIDT